MVHAAVPLKLAYIFASTPTSIRASEPGTNPNTIGLQVIVSDPSRSGMPMSKIEISIPIGQEISRDLTNSPGLPSPVYATSGLWIITTEGGTIAIEPRDGDEGQVTGPIVFTLPGIAVNESPGRVPLTITEFPTPDQKITDDTSYTLERLPADFPVTSFCAVPSSLKDLKQSVTLYWTCSEQGKQNAFGLHIANANDIPPVEPPDEQAGPFINAVWAAQVALQTATAFKTCEGDGDCYTWQDGVNGVVTPAVNETTTFALDVVQSDAPGHRTVIATLTATVDVSMPWISPNSYAQPIFGGRAVQLHWLAVNATSCTVALNGLSYDTNAPTDTYDNGYTILMPNVTGPQTFAVTAYAESGKARASFTFPPQQITPVVRIGGVNTPGSVAITPDAKTALVTNGPDSKAVPPTVTVIDLVTRTASPIALPSTEAPLEAVMTPDGKLALVPTGDGAVHVFDVPTRTFETGTIQIKGSFLTAISPDGKPALFGSFFNANISVIDIPGRKADPPIPFEKTSLGIAFSPDGKQAFVASATGTVTVIDVEKRAIQSPPIEIGAAVIGIAITPDGALALVTHLTDNSVSVIDLATRTVEPTTIPTGSQPALIAITPDSSLALVTNYRGGLTLVDIARRTSINLSWSGNSIGVAITPDGLTAVVTGVDSGSYVGVL